MYFKSINSIILTSQNSRKNVVTSCLIGNAFWNLKTKEDALGKQLNDYAKKPVDCAVNILICSLIVYIAFLDDILQQILHQILQSIVVSDSLRKMKKKNQKKQKKLRSIREDSGYRRGSFCENRLNYAKCNRVLRKGKCATKKAKKCKKTCGLCGGKI